MFGLNSPSWGHSKSFHTRLILSMGQYYWFPNLDGLGLKMTTSVGSWVPHFQPTRTHSLNQAALCCKQCLSRSPLQPLLQVQTPVWALDQVSENSFMPCFPEKGPKNIKNEYRKWLDQIVNDGLWWQCFMLSAERDRYCLASRHLELTFEKPGLPHGRKMHGNKSQKPPRSWSLDPKNCLQR